MRRMTGKLLLCSALPLLACAGGAPVVQSQETANAPGDQVIVEFTEMFVHPSVAHVAPGGSVKWVNYSSRYQGAIYFTKEVAAAFPCELSPAWSKTASGYQSAAITMGGMANEIQTPCAPKPGEYGYEVWLFDIMGGPGIVNVPSQRVRGEISVK